MSDEYDLKELRARNLPRCDWTTFLVEQGQLTDADRAALTEYFRHFLPPGPCVGCGAQLGGDPPPFGAARFAWGLRNGEGHCGRCGYLTRAYHRDIGAPGEPPLIQHLEMLLQYHPDEVVGADEHREGAA